MVHGMHPALTMAMNARQENSADFCDALISQVNIHSGCEYTVTFDKKAASLPGFDILGYPSPWAGNAS